MNFYSIRHLTRFRYAQPISESIMETRMNPARLPSALPQLHALGQPALPRLQLSRPPGNNVQHFDIPGEHNQLSLSLSQSSSSRRCLMCRASFRPTPGRLSTNWSTPAITGRCCCLDFAVETPALTPAGPPDGSPAAGRSADAGAGVEPAALRILRLRAALDARRLAIDEAIVSGQGRLPGFRAHHDRAAAPRENPRALRLRLSLSGARGPRPLDPRTRPTPGSMSCCRIWAGSASTRPIIWSRIIATSATAVGRDYADVPPTHGIFRGNTEASLM